VAEVPDFTLHLEFARHGLTLALVPPDGPTTPREELTTLVFGDAPASIVRVAHRSNQNDNPAITLLHEALLSALHDHEHAESVDLPSIDSKSRYTVQRGERSAPGNCFTWTPRSWDVTPRAGAASTAVTVARAGQRRPWPVGCLRRRVDPPVVDDVEGPGGGAEAGGEDVRARRLLASRRGGCSTLDRAGATLAGVQETQERRG
jgi:hypothetical protein